MTYCNLTDRKRIEFLNHFTHGFIYSQGYVNPLYMDEFEEEANKIIDKFGTHHNLGYLKGRFLKIFDFENYIFTRPDILGKQEGRDSEYYFRAKTRLNGSLRWRGHLRRMSKYMIFDEYDKEYARRIATELRPFVFARDGVKCVECSSQKELNVHHIKPVAKRGLSRMENLVTLCKPCHKEIHLKKDKRYLVV